MEGKVRRARNPSKYLIIILRGRARRSSGRRDLSLSGRCARRRRRPGRVFHGVHDDPPDLGDEPPFNVDPNGTLDWTPTSAQAGRTYNITLAVDDLYPDGDPRAGEPRGGH